MTTTCDPDRGFTMPTEPPPITQGDPVTVGAGLLACSVCGIHVPVLAEMWVSTDDDGDPILVLDSDLRDLELHMAGHEFAGDAIDVS